MNNQMNKKENGITMISLVVTIIVLIILAGIGVMAITGDNGLINRANNAKDSAIVKSEIRMVEVAANTAIQKNKYGIIEKEILEKELEKTAGKSKTEVESYENGLYFFVEFKNSHRVYEVNNEDGVRYLGARGDTLISGFLTSSIIRDKTPKTNREIKISFITLDNIDTNKYNIDIKYAWIGKKTDEPELLVNLNYEIDSEHGNIASGNVNTNEITKGDGSYYLYVEATIKDNGNVIETIKKIFGDYVVGAESTLGARYTVKHYFMNTSGEYLDDPIVEKFEGEVGGTVTPEVKTEYATRGFKVPEETSVNVQGNGKTTVEYFYERNKVTIYYNVNGGELNTTSSFKGPDGQGYVLDSSEQRLKTVCYYGGQTPSGGLLDYNGTNNQTGPEITKNNHTAKYHEEWNTNANGTGTSYNQTTILNSSNFANLSNGDATITLYVNWIFNPKMTVHFYANGAQGDEYNITDDLMTTEEYRYLGNETNESILIHNYIGGTRPWSLYKSGFDETGKWHVGNAASGTTINVNSTYSTGRDLAEAMGILTQFNQGDVTVNVYAGWGIAYLRVSETVFGQTTPFLGTTIERGKIKSISFATSISGHTVDGTTCFDVSNESGWGKVLLWITNIDSNGYYDIVIGQDGGVKANPDSSELFSYVGYYAPLTINFNNFNTSQVTDMKEMFFDCGYNAMTSLNLGNNFDTSKVTNMSYMFANCPSLITIYVPTSFVTTKVTNGSYMFTGDTSIVGGMGTTFNNSNMDHTYAHIDGGQTNPGYFTARP